MRRKPIIFIMSFVLFIGCLGFSGQSNTAESAQLSPPTGSTNGNSGWKKTCTQTNTGKVCKEYIDYYVSAFWTKAQVNSIYRKYSVLGHPATSVTSSAGSVALSYSKISNTIKKVQPFAIAGALNSLGAGASIERFRAAYYKERALRIDYTYRIYKHQTKGTYLSIKTTYV